MKQLFKVCIIDQSYFTGKHEETELCNVSVFAEALGEAVGSALSASSQDPYCLLLTTQNSVVLRGVGGVEEKHIPLLNEIFPILRPWWPRNPKYSVLPRTLCSMTKQAEKKSLYNDMTVVLCNLKLAFENKVQIIVSLCVSQKKHFILL